MCVYVKSQPFEGTWWSFFKQCPTLFMIFMVKTRVKITRAVKRQFFGTQRKRLYLRQLPQWMQKPAEPLEHNDSAGCYLHFKAEAKQDSETFAGFSG